MKLSESFTAVSGSVIINFGPFRHVPRAILFYTVTDGLAAATIAVEAAILDRPAVVAADIAAGKALFGGVGGSLNFPQELTGTSSPQVILPIDGGEAVGKYISVRVTESAGDNVDGVVGVS